MRWFPFVLGVFVRLTAFGFSRGCLFVLGGMVTEGGTESGVLLFNGRRKPDAGTKLMGTLVNEKTATERKAETNRN